jgi:hypothetical protein
MKGKFISTKSVLWRGLGSRYNLYMNPIRVPYRNVCFFYTASSYRIWCSANLSWCILLCLRYQNWDTANRSCTEAPSSRCSLWPGRPSSAWFQNRRSRSADSLRGRQQNILQYSASDPNKVEIMGSSVYLQVYPRLSLTVCRWFRFAQLAKGKKSRP